MMAIIVKKIFLGWTLLFALLLPSCGQLCIMGQGECPAFKSETEFSITPRSSVVTKDSQANQKVDFQLNGGTANFSLKANWTTTGLGSFNNTNFSGSSTTASTSALTFSFFLNKDISINQQEKITLSVTDADGKTASATLTVNP